jgi:hypothetical protein
MTITLVVPVAEMVVTEVAAPNVAVTVTAPVVAFLVTD